jgi:hypothetical protein
MEHRDEETVMKSESGAAQGGGSYGESRRDTRGTVRTVAAGRGQVRIRKSSSRRLRDLPELDLRTPSGRVLPF